MSPFFGLRITRSWPQEIYGLTDFFVLDAFTRQTECSYSKSRSRRPPHWLKRCAWDRLVPFWRRTMMVNTRRPKIFVPKNFKARPETRGQSFFCLRATHTWVTMTRRIRPLNRFSNPHHSRLPCTLRCKTMQPLPFGCATSIRPVPNLCHAPSHYLKWLTLSTLVCWPTDRLARCC